MSGWFSGDSRPGEGAIHRSDSFWGRVSGEQTDPAYRGNDDHYDDRRERVRRQREEAKQAQQRASKDHGKNKHPEKAKGWLTW